MANNTMWLIHKPTGLGCKLGKRMGYGWYGAPDAAHLDKFYEYLSIYLIEQRQDAFVLAMEHCDDEHEHCIDDWKWGAPNHPSGFAHFIFTGE